MCQLCTKFGKNVITDEKVMKKAMAAVDVAGLARDYGHVSRLISNWMGMPADLEPEDPEQAEAWEKSHR